MHVYHSVSRYVTVMKVLMPGYNLSFNYYVIKRKIKQTNGYDGEVGRLWLVVLECLIHTYSIYTHNMKHITVIIKGQLHQFYRGHNVQYYTLIPPIHTYIPLHLHHLILQIPRTSMNYCQDISVQLSHWSS